MSKKNQRESGNVYLFNRYEKMQNYLKLDVLYQFKKKKKKYILYINEIPCKIIISVFLLLFKLYFIKNGNLIFFTKLKNFSLTNVIDL